MESNLNAELSDFLKLSRFKAKMSQDEAAKSLGVSRATYNKYENKPVELSLTLLIKIGNIFNSNILDFFKDYIGPNE